MRQGTAPEESAGWGVTAGLRGSHYRRDRRGPVPGSAAGARRQIVGGLGAFG